MNLLLFLFLFLNVLHLILTVNEKKIPPTFDEIYGKGWDENDHQQIKVETSPLNSGENALNEQAHHDDNIDQDVEAYKSDSTDQNLTQEDPDCIDQSYNENETIEGINAENEFSEQEKREIICKFHAVKEELKKKGKFPATERVKIECKIGNKLGVIRDKIYKWKKKFGLSRKTKRNKNDFYEKKKCEFIARIKEIKMCQHGEQNKLIKDLGISTDTLRRWKKEFGLPIDSQIKYSDSKKLQVMGKYYKIKRKNPKISDRIIVNMLNIGYSSLCSWKKQFVNCVYQHQFSENAGAVQDLITSEHPMPSSDDHLWAWNLRTKKRTERIEVEHSVKK